LNLVEQTKRLVKLLVTRKGESDFHDKGTQRGRKNPARTTETRPAMSWNVSVSAGSMRTPDAVPAMPKRVLIVEDNELNMKLFNDLLEANGYQVIQTRDGLSALDLARKHRPDLILMDIQLPEVSGIEVTKWLKEDDTLRHIPVIAVTAFAMKGDEQKIREGGCEAYISKPISVVSFLQTIDSYLKKPE
jgi:two-component system cell cycle response regulator DivK